MYALFKQPRGFIALISIIIVSVVLFASTLSLAQFGLMTRYYVLDMEHKTASEKRAEACVAYARIIVHNDPNHVHTEPIDIPVGDASCIIVSITRDGSENTIRAQGTRGNSITNLEVAINTSNDSLVSWKEVSSF